MPNNAVPMSQTPNTLNSERHNPWRFCTAPMMEWSDTHCRYFWRQLSKHARLYTEMVTTNALIHGDRSRFLAFDKVEHPVALQLGGSNPQALAECAKIAEDAGFDEVNLNCGCPSDRVQENKIGACLMAESMLVAECLAEMQQAVQIPVTVKHRLGIDDLDSKAHFEGFVETVKTSGCQVFIVHARKAWLNGLSPKENREVPPLNYDWVYELKAKYPELTIVVNGGVNTLADCETHLAHLDGVMMGREAYHNPFVLAGVDQQLFDDGQMPNREQVLQAFIDYSWTQWRTGTKLHHMSRHILGIFAGQHGGKRFRRFLSENACKQDASPALLQRALDEMMHFQVQHENRLASSNSPT